MTAPITVWLAAADQPDPVLARLAALLDPEERRRAGELADPGSRREFVVGHGLGRLLLGELLGRPAGRLRFGRGPHGKPELAESDRAVWFNLSHSAGLVAFAISLERPVGVDVQRHERPDVARRMAGRYYPAAEAAWLAEAADDGVLVDRFGRLWARKEACAKALGGRLIPVLAVPVLDRPVAEVAAGPVALADLPVPAGYSAAVAAAGSAPVSALTSWWQPDAAAARTDPMAVAPC